MYIVLLEQDGMKPKSRYYEQRARLALKVRGGDLDPNLSPVSRRTYGGEKLAQIIQEGAILTPSYSQATTICQLAQEHGIKTVFIGTVDVSPYEATPADRTAYEKIQKVLSKKGRKPEPEMHTITCYEEMLTYELTASEALLCPGCHGLNIQTRIGAATRVQPPSEEQNLCTYWLMTRFIHGQFEIPIQDDEAPALSTYTYQPVPEGSLPLVDKILRGMIPEIIATIPLSVKGKLDLLDAAFITRSYWPTETRDHTRAQALVMWMREFQGSADFPLMEPEIPDVIDCAGLIGVKRALNIYRTYRMEVET